MRKVLATIIKEWILLRRDVAGFMLLFLMPAILIVVMALIQDAPFKDYQNLRFDLLLADNDHGRLAAEITRGLKQSDNFQVIDSINNRPLSDSALKQLLQQGNYRVGIVIPAGATAEMVNTANTVANKIAEKIGVGKLPAREARSNKYVRIYFDPVSRPTFRLSVNFALDKLITASCSNVLIDRMSKLSGDTASAPPTEDFRKMFSGIGIREEALNDKTKDTAHINSVQHNVPAWAIFGMFFIVIPLAGNMIRERDERSALRVQLIPNANSSVALGKIFFYTLVCMVQFALMLCIGLWLLPVFGLPALYLGLHPFALLPIVLCIGLSATSYGFFIGTLFKTATQAMPFGAISVVILSALGGIWIPTDIMPAAMQKLAMASPLYWGLDAVNDIILRDNKLSGSFLALSVLLVFSILLWLVSLRINKVRTYSVQ